jgi:hypothetical protein
MKEDFLHYAWQYKKFDFSNLTTVSGEKVTVVHVGQYLQQAGSDFFNAQIIIDNQKWAGNVEIHVKSSDWYLHQHEQDNQYNNVILHVVWEYDVPIFRKDNSVIPTVALKSFVSKAVLQQYLALTTPKSWIFCESQIRLTDTFVVKNWLERLFFERLENKAVPIKTLLAATNNDWEAVLFYSLAKNFGLNTNGEIFFKALQSIPFAVVRKESFEVRNLEALFFSQLDLLLEIAEDTYAKDLLARASYLTQKYHLKKNWVEPVQFFKHRPDNFPTIRLSQLANLYHIHQNLFSILNSSNSVKRIYEIFDVSTSDYWQNHYQFDKESPKKKKRISKSFVDLIIINTIIPLQFAYAKSQGKENSEDIIQLINEVNAEKNAIIDKFSSFGIPSKTALASQSLLQLKNEYCNKSKCLECAIGIELLKNNS